ncbi:MAG: POTRA domain-containing protein, partial [Bdellovibrionales bacterium]
MLLSSFSWAKASFSIKTENPQLSIDLKNSLSIKSNESAQDVETKVKAFLIKHGYYTASIEVKNKTVKIKNPTKWNLFFEGNKFYSRHFLKKSLVNSAFSTVPETLIPELEQSLVKTYKSAGFHFVKVKSDLVKNPKKFNAQLIFKIKEYEIVKLKNISISGDFGPLKKKDLLKRLQRYSGEQVSKDVYYDNALTSGISSLKNDLNNLGFFNAYVGLEDLKFNLQKNRVSAKIKVYVNSPTVLSSVSFKGNSK